MHVLSQEESLMASRLLLLYPALYSAVAELHGFPALKDDEREAILRLADRLGGPAISVEVAVQNMRAAGA